MDGRERDGIRIDLQSSDEEIRRLAVERLVALPPDEALPQIVDCLGDPSWRVRKAAVERLMNLEFKVFPDSAAARGEQGALESRPSTEQVALAAVLSGAHV